MNARTAARSPRTARPAAWLETMRLALREFTRDDVDDLYRLDQDPRVVRYVGTGKPIPRAEVAERLARNVRNYALYPGLGTWYATRRDTGAFVGWFSLKYCPPTTDVEIGYRLQHDAWGHGYATEGATELVRYAFDDLGLYRVIAVTHPQNAASQHVLRKVGLNACGWSRRYYERRLRVFAIERPR